MDPYGRWSSEVEVAGAVGAKVACEPFVVFARRKRAAIVLGDAQRHAVGGMDKLTGRFPVMPIDGGAQYGMVCHDRRPCRRERVSFLGLGLTGDNLLDVETATGRSQGMDEHAGLDRSEVVRFKDARHSLVRPGERVRIRWLVRNALLDGLRNRLSVFVQ